jgi:hypothetical protein
VLAVGRGSLDHAAGAEQPAQVGRRAERAPVLVGDPVVGEQLAEARLGHAGAARLRPEADVDHPLDPGRLELGDELRREEPLVADREQPGGQATKTGVPTGVWE